MEELMNAVSHGVGFMLAVASLPILVYGASQNGSAAAVVGASLFAGTAIVLYLIFRAGSRAAGWAGETVVQSPGSRGHLSFHRRQLHAFCTGRASRPLELDFVWCSLVRRRVGSATRVAKMRCDELASRRAAVACHAAIAINGKLFR